MRGDGDAAAAWGSRGDSHKVVIRWANKLDELL